MGTGASSGRAEVTGIDGAPVGVNVASSECEGDCEYLILTDTGNDTDFLRQICTDCDGDETITDTELDGVTPYVPTAEANVVIVQRGALRDTEILVLCDTGNADKQYVQRYTFNNNGTVRSSAELEFDGTAYAGFVGPAALCDQSMTLDFKDVEVEVLCDQQADLSIVEFLRTYTFDDDGTLDGFVDTELDGSTAYAPTGTVRDCAVAAQEAGACQSGFGGVAKHTALTSSGDTYTTSADARRVTINYQANSAAAPNRPEIAFNGGAPSTLGKNGDQTQVVFGTLDTCDTLGYTITIDVNQNAQHVDIFEEF